MPRKSHIRRDANDLAGVNQKKKIWAICWGQSNMKGFSEIELPDVSIVSDINDLDIQFYDYTNGGGNGDTGGNFVAMDTSGTYGSKWGGARPFARRLNEKLSRYDVFVTKHSFGGRGIFGYDAHTGDTLGTDSYNSVNGTRYTDLISKLQDAQSDLGFTPDRVVFFAYHGNRDGQYSTSANAYSANFQALVSGVRTALGYSASQMPVVFGLSHSIQFDLGDGGSDVGCQFVATIRSQQIAAASAITNAAYFDTDDFAVEKDEIDGGTHLNAPSYDRLGTRAADVYLSTLF